MTKPDIGIDAKKLRQVAALLSKVLADAHVLYIKTRFYHWNVSGPSFMELHKLFESQYETLAEAIDEIAERISKLGETVPGTMTEFIKLSALKEQVAKSAPEQMTMIKNLLNDHETVIKSLRTAIDDCEEKYEDKGTADFLTELLQSHETIAWTLRRYLS